MRVQISALRDTRPDYPANAIEIAAACAMLHSFYTEIEKILRLIAREFDGREPTSGSWDKELLHQMATPTDQRPEILNVELHQRLIEFRDFRHVFRGASIAIMRWPKIAPLLSKVDECHASFRQAMDAFLLGSHQ